MLVKLNEYHRTDETSSVQSIFQNGVITIFSLLLLSLVTTTGMAKPPVQCEGDEACPNLIVEPYDWPDTVRVGLLHLFHFDTMNVGEETAGFSKTMIRFENGNQLGYDNVPALEPGEVRQAYTFWMPQVCGVYSIYGMADANGWVDESNEFDNWTPIHTFEVVAGYGDPCP